jgi:hypothetical protein
MIRFVDSALVAIAIVGISAMAQNTVKKTPIPYTPAASGRRCTRVTALRVMAPMEKATVP